MRQIYAFGVILMGDEPCLNMELNDLRIIIYCRKSEGTIERISVCNVIENLVEHGI